MKKAITWFLSRPLPQQVIIAVVLIVVALFILRSIRSLFTGWFTGFQRNIQLKGEATQLSLEGQKKSFSPSQYEAFANQLFYALDGGGTDEPAIFNVFSQMKNDLDVIELERVFGFRASEKWYNTSDKYSLGEWLRSDMEQDEMDQYVNAPLREKGITKSY